MWTQRSKTEGVWVRGQLRIWDMHGTGSSAVSLKIIILSSSRGSHETTSHELGVPEF